MGEQVYCVMQSELYGDGACLNKVFRNKNNADEYCKIQNQLNEWDCFYVVPKFFADEEFNENVEVVDYYNYFLYLDEKISDNIEDYIVIDPEKQIYTYSDYVIMYEDSLDAYSTESYTKAKALAINARNKLMGYYYNTEIKYEVINRVQESPYFPYDTKRCPICKGPIKHPYTGSVTTKQLDEDIESCLLIEVLDENNNTLGYRPLCKHQHDKKTEV